MGDSDMLNCGLGKTDRPKMGICRSWLSEDFCLGVEGERGLVRTPEGGMKDVEMTSPFISPGVAARSWAGGSKQKVDEGLRPQPKFPPQETEQLGVKAEACYSSLGVLRNSILGANVQFSEGCPCSEDTWRNQAGEGTGGSLLHGPARWAHQCV